MLKLWMHFKAPDEVGLTPLTNSAYHRGTFHQGKISRRNSFLCPEPVPKLYKEQNKLPFEKNWANEVSRLREHYNIMLRDSELKQKRKMENFD